MNWQRLKPFSIDIDQQSSPGRSETIGSVIPLPEKSQIRLFRTFSEFPRRNVDELFILCFYGGAVRPLIKEII